MATIVRPAYAVTLVAVLLLSLGGFAFFRLRDGTPLMGSVTPSTPAAGWDRAMGDAVPAPGPTALPLLGPAGVDREGYPLQYVDRPALQSLLRHHRYAELTKYLTQFQDEFEKDPRKEYWITDATLAFASSKPELDVLFDEWVAAMPTSFAPWLARGMHRVELGWARRGTLYSKDTSSPAFRAMDEAFNGATKDLDTAFSLRSKLVVALQLEIRMSAAHAEKRSARSLVDDATVSCPSCFLVKVAYMLTLRPRWGGDYAKMHAFAAEWNPSLNGRFAVLDGYPDLDQCDLALIDEKPAVADAAVTRALAKGDHADFYECRARLHRHRHAFPQARADFARADALRPGQPDVLAQLAEMESQTGNDEAAGKALLAAVRIDLGNVHVHSAWGPVVGGLQREAITRAKDDSAGAIALLDLAWLIQPRQAATLDRRARILVGKDPSTPGTANYTDLERGLEGRPDDLAFHQAFDFALAQQGQFQRVVEIWTTFLAAHPDESLAYMERSGAYYHLGKAPEMSADQKKACALGWLEGCGTNPR